LLIRGHLDSPSDELVERVAHELPAVRQPLAGLDLSGQAFPPPFPGIAPGEWRPSAVETGVFGRILIDFRPST